MICSNQKELWIDGHGFILVPCGKCIPCLLNKRNDWSFRLQQEHRASKEACFVTLTYDEKHLRTDRSLNKRDLQLFFKRLRKLHGRRVRIRYYAVGEYGTHFGRPHYHILLFNCVEQLVRKAWTDSKGQSIGNVHIGKVTEASIAYCTKYVVQRASAPEGLLPPFSTMSRAYGIGAHYLSDDMVNWHRENDANYVVRPGNVKGRLPRFYRERIWYRDEDKKRISKAAMELVLQNQRIEEQYYKENHGEFWKSIMDHAYVMWVSRVESKLKYSQTF